MSSTAHGMSFIALRRYACSCGLLLVPALVWNLAFAGQLPPAFSPELFWRDIPQGLALAENGLRLAVFALPFFMPLQLASPAGRRGLLIYAAGTAIYFASWLALMLSPESGWLRSAWGFLAPACTPLLWFLGIALMGQRLFWGRAYRWWMYLLLVSGFLAAHVLHAALIYARSY